MIIGVPILAAGMAGIYVASKLPNKDQEEASNKYTELFKNMGILRENEWVKLVKTKRNKAYNVFSFEIADSVAVDRFKENETFIAEKIYAKDEFTNRLNIFYSDGEMHFRIIHATVEQEPFKPIKPPTPEGLLIGHDLDYLPIWSNDVNLFVTGTTGMGKSTIIHCIILNMLHNRQGYLCLGDLKGTEFWEYRNKKGVYKVADTMEDLENMVYEFIGEYQARIKLLRDGNRQYKNYAEYNKCHKKKMEPYALVIDEFADLALKYTKKGEPFGLYLDLVSLCAKIRCTNGRVILGTQRPSVDIVKGILKNNFNFVGMRMINAINSRIVIDEEGLEDLEKFRAKIRLEGKLVDVFAYKLTEEMIKEQIDKLPDKD